ncbi:RrF2 family transcriptional regulator [Tepidimicrobium xylanilyticum]|uniref:Transcriptional regulator, BadM/Rrf2 family n=1 Tax=Tepidimicrobium xylanilyticum TaxID=1123352 RepID=A0A1H2SJM3_9FIRM|nr:Rrf2 family transcriptional regulator [Tepidimicrobium xylanilyticum]GMG96194.1 AsnC family transcriptional regulator [Tepidimicrobium xylanilyticum]SDW31903.1 transcriptional regulator, BadM/Rrf2 family [Tepidimicrobium xylanilyticum]
MRLSTRGRYGLKAMYQLAIHYGEGPIPLNSIASAQEISENYLEQLMSPLRKAGLLNSVRGAQGGYMLAKSPSEITVGSILRALEGEMAPVDCVLENFSGCEREENCVTKLVWLKMKEGINEVIDSISLQDMLNERAEMESKKSRA